MRAKDLLGARAGDLRALLREGHPIDPHSLDDFEYSGTSLGIPAFVERLTWKRFKKVFHRDPVTGTLGGWNVRIRQNDLDAPPIPLLHAGAKVTFGHFAVVTGEDPRVPSHARRGLLLDYGAGGNAAWDPARLVRDPIVALAPGSADLLLGWTYLRVGPWSVPTPSYFTLERDVPLTHRVAPPGRRASPSP